MLHSDMCVFSVIQGTQDCFQTELNIVTKSLLEWSKNDAPEQIIMNKCIQNVTVLLRMALFM